MSAMSPLQRESTTIDVIPLVLSSLCPMISGIAPKLFSSDSVERNAVFNSQSSNSLFLAHRWPLSPSGVAGRPRAFERTQPFHADLLPVFHLIQRTLPTSLKSSRFGPRPPARLASSVSPRSGRSSGRTRTSTLRPSRTTQRASVISIPSHFT